MSASNESQRNIEALRPVYEAWGRDWAVGPEVYGPQMVWGWSDEFPEIHDKALVAVGFPPG